MYILRQYKKSDVDDILSVWENASKVAHPFLKEAFQTQVREDIPKVYLPRADTWVVETDNMVVGFIALIGNEIGALFIQPEHQGKGLGKLLLDKAQELHDELILGVFEKNVIALRFYLKYGFNVMEKRIHQQTGEPELRLRFTVRSPNSTDSDDDA